MQKDEARKWTDKQLAEMEGKIYKIYAEALESMQVKWDDFAKKIEPEIAVYKKRLDEAIKSGDSATVKEARSQYADALREKTLMDRYYKDMVDQTIDELSNVNQTAVAYLNDEVAQIYAINYNQFAKDLPKIKSNYVFDLVDASTVKVLATKDSSLLPYKQIDKYKDEAWNRKIINSQILQGIVEGESIDKIAKRLQNVVNADESSAIRNARTMTTSAECKGRMDSYHKAIENGIRMKKVWIATSDDRTRAWHMELDGAEAEVDEPFVNEYGEIMQPGDPDADPCNVYNCRCSIKMKLLGFEKLEGENQKQIETSQKQIETSEQEQEALASAEVGTPMLEYKLEKADENAEKQLTNSEKNDIIKENETNKQTTVANLELINSDEYKNKFVGITGKTKVDSEICRISRRCIRINDGKETESYAIVDMKGNSSNIFTAGKLGGIVDDKLLNSYATNSAILVHNHPYSTSFSADDIDLLMSYNSIKTIIAVGHNGTVYSLSLNDGKKIQNIFSYYNVVYDEMKSNADETIKMISKTHNWDYEVK